MPISTVRDLAIIVLAVQSFVLGLLLIVLAVQIWFLIRLVRRELGPLLESARKTAENVRHTSRAVGGPLGSAARVGAVLGIARRFYRLIKRTG